MSTAWSISEVAKLSKVSSRTLRHYDALGLLRPAYTGHNGYRFYEQEQLRRLQRILLLRELGLGLETVAEVLDGQVNERQALEVHHEWLLVERERLTRMAGTVARTITALELGETMTAEDMFTGFEHNPYEAEARQRWGDQAVDASNAKLESLSKDQQQAMMDEAQRINASLADCMERNLPAEDEPVQDAVAAHYRWVSLHWTPDAQSYVGLGQLYVDDPRFTKFYDKVEPGLAAYLLAGIKVYAARNLPDGPDRQD